ncbi:MAG: hypothetical protein IT410_03275 [Candidatus Doudnabacteria bacterium]|nr:hypothetical protein [Candidatus Doudnabacteria bacterium]
MKIKIFGFNGQKDADDITAEINDFLASGEVDRVISMTQSSTSYNLRTDLRIIDVVTVITILYETP